MLDYLLAMGFSFLFSFLYDLNHNSLTSLTGSEKKNNIWLTVRGIAFVILAGFPFLYLQAKRNELGADYQLYSREFIYINTGSGYVHTDLGFQELNKLVYSLGGDYKAMFATVAVIQTIGIYSLAVCSNIPLSMFSLLYFFSFHYLQSYSLIAQYTAIGLICLAFSFLLKRSYIPSFILLAIATTVHSSASVFFAYFFFFLLLKRTKSRSRLTALYVTIVVVFAGVAGKLFPVILKHTRFGVYYSRDNTDLNSTSMIVISALVVFLMVSVYMAEEKARSSLSYNFFLAIQLMALFSSLLQPVVPLMVRMAMYFSFFEIYAIPLALKTISGKQLRFIGYTVALFVFVAWFYMYPVSGNYYQVIPYK